MRKTRRRSRERDALATFALREQRLVDIVCPCQLSYITIFGKNVLPSAAAPSLEASAPLSHHSRIRRRVVGLSDPATNRSRTSGRRCRTGEDARSGYRRDTDSGERRRLRRAEPDRQQAGDPHPTALMFHVKHLYVYGHCREDGALACRRRGYFFPLRAEAMSPVKPWA